MKLRISDMMDYIEDNSVNIYEKEIASLDKIKEVTMKKIEGEKKVGNYKMRRMSRVSIIVAVLVLSMAFTGTALAYMKWTGFAYTSEMNEAEKKELLKSGITTAGESIDADGNVHYIDNKGNEIMILSAEDAAKYEQEKSIEQSEKVQKMTNLVDISTIPLVPSGITEINTDSKGQFEEFILGNGYMLLLQPKDMERYSMRKGDVVTISLNADDTCTLEFGMIKDGRVIETNTNRNNKHKCSFRVEEDGNYNFYIMYYSADKSIFTDCILCVE